MDENQSPTHWPSAWQFGLSLLAIVGLALAALAFAALGLSDFFGPLSDPIAGLSLLLTSSGLILSAALVIPSAGYALARLTTIHFALPHWLGLKRLRWSILLFPLVVLAGDWVSQRPSLSIVFLPPLHLLALGLPVLWFLWIGVRELPLGPPQRAWGVFAGGLVLGPVVILTAEALAAVGIFALAVAFVATRPGLAQAMTGLVEELGTAVQQDPERVLALLEPYLSHPAVIATTLIFAAGIVPVIEESLKPMGVWILGRRRISPAEGFAAGLLSGAGFALFENLALASQANSWALAVTARTVTALLHIVTAGLMGWALAEAWRMRRYERLVLTFLAAVTIHGLWNAFTLLAVSATLTPPGGDGLRSLEARGVAAAVGIAALSVTSLMILIRANRYHRLAEPQSPGPDEEADSL